jgi:mycoredoxin
MNDTRLVVYVTFWCFDCRRVRRWLDQHQIDYALVDIDTDPDADALVRKLNRGYRSVPTLVFPDGSLLVEPSISTLAAHLGLNKRLDTSTNP